MMKKQKEPKPMAGAEAGWVEGSIQDFLQLSNAEMESSKPS
jgi:hypothetical protein